MITIYDRGQGFKLLLESMNIQFIQSKGKIAFFEGENLISIEPDYLVDNGVDFYTESMDMSEFNYETNYFLNDWLDKMSDDRFEEFLKAYNEISEKYELFFLEVA